VWVSWFQFFIGLVLAPIQAIPGFGVSIEQVPVELYEGLLCFFGDDTENLPVGFSLILWCKLPSAIHVLCVHTLLACCASERGGSCTLLLLHTLVCLCICFCFCLFFVFGFFFLSLSLVSLSLVFFFHTRAPAQRYGFRFSSM
jgi:hypothetical protein